MTKRMLIDSTHAEETRLVVLDGNRLEDFDIETSTKQQLKGNIYLAKVVRVEPSLQAAFVEYGGNRHGFLAFGEIHPDYYQIPVADRKRLLEAQEAEAREDEEAADREAAREAGRSAGRNGGRRGESASEAGDDATRGDEIGSETGEPATDHAAEHGTFAAEDGAGPALEPEFIGAVEGAPVGEPEPHAAQADRPAQPAAMAQDMILAPYDASSDASPDAEQAGTGTGIGAGDAEGEARFAESGHDDEGADGEDDEGSSEPPPEQIGGELETEEHVERRASPRFLRNYKIQEVIRRRQILLVQVVKEERGTKGAALTTYISLAGRFSVLMPNSPRGGGISRKITSAADRRRLKEVTAELDLPRGMGLIVRTAGANRPKPEILRDCEYLLNQWDQVRDLTMKSIAPALIYEEASLIKRAIRDVYSRDVDDILVDGEQGWRAARDFMRMLMPTHARKVQLWKDPQPLFAKAQVEAQLDAVLSPTVQLKSGGYLVINQTEALVAIDVNSGRSTRERGIEETALKTNLEAADEAARQLRLRDMAGLIVIDFIDMESRRNIAAVERRLKDALKVDRARIQVGSISHFGLLEMSRQRLRPSLSETNFTTCPHCTGTGQVRSTESAALHVLRAVEEEGGKRRAAEIVVHCAGSIALYILNNKRVRLGEIEARHGLTVTFAADDTLLPPAIRIERVRAQATSDLPPPVSQLAPPEPFEDPDELEVEAATEEADEDEAAEAAPANETAEEREQRRGRGRRRRRRGGRRDDAGSATGEAGEPGATEPGATEPGATEPGVTDAAATAQEPRGEADAGEPATAEGEDGQPAQARTGEAATAEEGENRRRGRRGGRRRRRDHDGEAGPAAAAEETGEPVETAVAIGYAGPTPADPFAGPSAFDIFEAIEQAQERAVAQGSAASGSATSGHEEAPEPVAATTEPAIAPEHAAASAAVDTPAVADAAHVASSAPVSQPEPSEPVLSDVAVPEPVAPIVPPAAAEPITAEPVAPVEPGPVVGPVIAPTVIGEDAAPAEKKRGWWRR